VKDLATEAHRKWLAAFFWWYRTGDRSHMDALRTRGVPLCTADATFLRASEPGGHRNGHAAIHARSGRRTGLHAFTQQIIDNEIQGLLAQGVTHQEIVRRMCRPRLLNNEKPLVDTKRFTIYALRQRIQRMKRRARDDMMADFMKIYRAYSRTAK
jgi:hypothetical protein